MFFSPSAFFLTFYPAYNNAEEIAKLNELKGSLKTSFEQAFGEDALKMYYTGKIKQPVYTAEDLIEYKFDGTQKSDTKDFNPHFPHAELADDLGIKFIQLHRILQPYFMAAAMHKDTGNSLYADLADDLFTDFTSTALQQDQNLTEAQFKTVKTEIARAVNTMIEHTLPPQYRPPIVA